MKIISTILKGCKQFSLMSRLVAFAAALCIMGCSSTGDASTTEKAKEDARSLNEALRGRGGTVPQDAFLKAVVDNDVQAVREMAKENPSVLSKGYRYSAGMPYAILTRAPMEIALSLHKPEMIATLLELEAPCDADEICAGIWCIQDGPPNTTADDRKKTLDILFQYKPGLLKDKDFCYDLMDRTINFPSPEVLEYLLNKGISAKLEKVDKINNTPPMTLLDIAYMVGSDECVKILRAHGAKKHPNFDSSVYPNPRESLIIVPPPGYTP